MKALKVYNTEVLNRFHKRKVHNTNVVEEPQDDPPEPSEPDSNRLSQEKKAQMGNNLGEQQVNNNNKAKAK